MIWVTRLNGERFLINPDLIEFIEERPDTTVTLTSGRKVVVLEAADELVDRIIGYRQSIYIRLPRLSYDVNGEPMMD